MRKQTSVPTSGIMASGIDLARAKWKSLEDESPSKAIVKIVEDFVNSQDPSGRNARLRELADLTSEILMEIRMTRASIDALRLIQENIKDGVPVDHLGCGDD